MTRRKKTNRNKKRVPIKHTPENLPDSLAHTTQITTAFSGPIPPATELQQYNQVVPDAAERIIKMAENEQAHQIEIDKLTVQLISEERKRGQNYGIIVAVLALMTTALALWCGKEIAASVIGGTTVVGLVTVFVTGRSKEKN